MNRHILKVLSLSVVLLTAIICFAAAQEPPREPERPPEPGAPPLPPIPERLEEMIDIAMSQNPDIRVAETQVQQAEAELRRVRLQAFRELNTLNRERVRIREQLDLAVALDREQSATPRQKADLEAQLAGVEMQIRYLLGIGPEGGPVPGDKPRLPRESLVSRPRPPIPPDIEERLKQRLSVVEPTRLGELLSIISQNTGVLVVPDVLCIDNELEVRAGKDMMLRDVLLALADQHESLCFVIRDYGILATVIERAETMVAPTIPADIPLYVPAPRLPSREGALPEEVMRQIRVERVEKKR